MSRVIRISDETFSRLQNLAEPLVDTPASVIEKLLDEYESTLSKNKSGEKMESYNPKSNHNFFREEVSANPLKNIKQIVLNFIIFISPRFKPLAGDRLR